MVVILDKKLNKEVQEEIHKRHPDKTKRCMRCQKVLRKQNRTYLCTAHYREYHRQTQRIHRILRKLKAEKENRK